MALAVLAFEFMFEFDYKFDPDREVGGFFRAKVGVSSTPSIVEWEKQSTSAPTPPPHRLVSAHQITLSKRNNQESESRFTLCN